MNIDDEIAAKYNIPQGIKDWKIGIEKEIDSLAVIIAGKKYVKLHTAKNFMKQCFTKGFKVARRNRNALGKYLISEMEKKFIVNPNTTGG